MTPMSFVLILFLAGFSQAASSPKYVVELYVVVEPGVVHNRVTKLGYNQDEAKSMISKEIKFMAFQVDKMFQSMNKYHLDVEIRLKESNILEKPLYPKCKRNKDGKLQRNVALETFNDLLVREGSRKKIKYDIAILYTAYDLYFFQSESSSSYIIGNKEQICKRFSTLIQEYQGTYKDVQNTAKYIAELLHAPEDTRHECGIGYLMAKDEDEISDNNWAFSNCTAAAINTTLLGIKTNCFLKTRAPKVTFDLSSMVGSDILDPEKNCQRKLNTEEAYFCAYQKYYKRQRPHGDAVCKRIHCDEKYRKDKMCSPLISPEYMVCDPGKRCQQGKCVAAPKELPVPVSVKSSECVFGDIKMGMLQDLPFKTFYESDCSDFYYGKRHQCYTSEFFESCCGFCMEGKTNVKGCEYGDAIDTCCVSKIEDRCGKRNGNTCCDTCSKGPCARDARDEEERRRKKQG